MIHNLDIRNAQNRQEAELATEFYREWLLAVYDTDPHHHNQPDMVSMFILAPYIRRRLRETLKTVQIPFFEVQTVDPTTNNTDDLYFILDGQITHVDYIHE